MSFLSAFVRGGSTARSKALAMPVSSQWPACVSPGGPDADRQARQMARRARAVPVRQVSRFGAYRDQVQFLTSRDCGDRLTLQSRIQDAAQADPLPLRQHACRGHG
ncbi:hypothetical protein PF003_g28727 [Phytophthora fragariae]|nr:hypothetical protein PF003_g28727 [Phytophthora fragariae]